MARHPFTDLASALSDLKNSFVTDVAGSVWSIGRNIETLLVVSILRIGVAFSFTHV